MHDTIPDIVDPTTDPTLLEERDQRIATMFKPNERVWIVDEHYFPDSTIWRIDLVSRSKEGYWMRKRYRYEVPTRVLYFMGQRPLSEEEFATVRREGKPFRKHQER